jgi:monoamine oxidase
MLEIAVIGGGLSGLVAAHRLVQAGRQSVSMFEARDRVGGRTVNQPFGSGHVVECGGQWVGPTQKRVLALAKELGVATFRTPTRGRNLMFLGNQRHAYRGAMPLGQWRVHREEDEDDGGAHRRRQQTSDRGSSAPLSSFEREAATDERIYYDC